MKVKELTAKEAKQIYDKKDTVVIDVRNKDELSVKIKGAMNMPLDKLQDELEKVPQNKTLLVNCNTGMRSKQACQILQDAHFKNLYSLKGGIQAWQKENLPIELGKKRLPIMRQVQNIVGSVFIITSLLGKPWIYIGTFFGAGLLFAGLSGTCGMAKVLEFMPWNK